MGALDSAKRLYEQQYKKLLLIPFLLLVAALLQIGVQYAQTGDFVNKGVSLKGGSTITFAYQESLNPEALQTALRSEFPRGVITVRTISSAGSITALAVDSDAQEPEEIDALLLILQRQVGSVGPEGISGASPGSGAGSGAGRGDFSVEIMGASLGKEFFTQTITAMLVAFLLMGLVVLLYFRTLVPSAAVILAAASDIIVTLAIFNLTGMKLSTAGIAAFLMLIGYSVDTDILLSSRILKRTELPLQERIYSAIKTGLTMSVTSLAAIAVALFLVQSEVVQQIMVILFIGLLVDIIMTYLQNASILRLYVERKHGGVKNAGDDSRYYSR